MKLFFYVLHIFIERFFVFTKNYVCGINRKVQWNYISMDNSVRVLHRSELFGWPRSKRSNYIIIILVSGFSRIFNKKKKNNNENSIILIKIIYLYTYTALYKCVAYIINATIYICVRKLHPAIIRLLYRLHIFNNFSNTLDWNHINMYITLYYIKLFVLMSLIYCWKVTFHECGVALLINHEIASLYVQTWINCYL